MSTLHWTVPTTTEEARHLDDAVTVELPGSLVLAGIELSLTRDSSLNYTGTGVLDWNGKRHDTSTRLRGAGAVVTVATPALSGIPRDLRTQLRTRDRQQTQAFMRRDDASRVLALLQLHGLLIQLAGLLEQPPRADLVQAFERLTRRSLRHRLHFLAVYDHLKGPAQNVGNVLARDWQGTSEDLVAVARAATDQPLGALHREKGKMS